MPSILSSAAKVGGTIACTTIRIGKAIAQKTLELGNTIANTAVQIGRMAANLATTLGGRTRGMVERATQDMGRVVTFVGDAPLIRPLSRVLKLNWLVDVTDKVDLQKAEAAVKELQQKYPNESPRQIAHRIMVEKATYAGGVGLASSLVPGGAIALLAVDLAATTALQAEMLYQIAAAYGLNLQDSARKGEILAIFALSLGGSRAIKAGLAVVKSVPVAGAVIGASANATMLYTLGYAACRFYEAKLDPTVAETSTSTLEDIKASAENYMTVAIAQETTMDQILVHMILAAYPEKTWGDVLPELQSLHLSPSSLKAIANHIKAPQPLISLLDQLDQDFAVLTLSRCYTIAQLDGTISPKEAQVLNIISERFKIDLDEIRATINGNIATLNDS
jgi:uncharacterized protein (DUF697 family)